MLRFINIFSFTFLSVEDELSGIVISINSSLETFGNKYELHLLNICISLLYSILLLFK